MTSRDLLREGWNPHFGVLGERGGVNKYLLVIPLILFWNTINDLFHIYVTAQFTDHESFERKIILFAIVSSWGYISIYIIFNRLKDISDLPIFRIKSGWRIWVRSIPRSSRMKRNLCYRNQVAYTEIYVI